MEGWQMEVVAPDEVPALQLSQVELLGGHQVEELPSGQQLHHHDYLPGTLENGKSHVVFHGQVERGEVKSME
jgi:hypothetical protein